MSGALQAVFQNLRSFGPPSGQQVYTGVGTYTWVAPAGVTKISAMVVGGGNAGQCVQGSGPNCWTGGAGGGSGSRVWSTNKTVVPGNSYTMKILGTPQIATAFCGGGACLKIQAGDVNTYVGCSVGMFRIRGIGGGIGSCFTAANAAGGGGGGVAGFTTQSNTAGPYPCASGFTKGGGGGQFGCPGASGWCGGGGGGGGATTGGAGGGGGGSSLLGNSSPGNIGNNGSFPSGGGGGASGGAAGSGKNGGAYGGAGGGGAYSGGVVAPGTGAGAGIRIMWPGCTRSYPSTNTNDV